MTAFDHRTSGTSAQSWQTTVDAAAELPVPGPRDHLLVVAAHPDDESLGAGGLTAMAAERGARVTVIVASAGEASHPSSRTHRPAVLAERRRLEVRAAVAETAPQAELVLLGLPDGQLERHRKEISAAIDAVEGVTHLATPWTGDGHPDHAACASAAEQSFSSERAQHWQFPIWAWHWGDPGGTLAGHATGRVSLGTDAHRAKDRAIDRHVSQHEALSDQPGDEPILPEHFLDHFRRDAELFVVETEPGRVPDAYFADLYEHSEDPWGLADRFYEQRKRALLLAALTRPRFRRAFEPGCATGLLTAELARRCDEVLAWDVVGDAVEQTAKRVVDQSGVTVGYGAVPDDWPDGRFDLIVLSEVGYYCASPAALAERVMTSLADDGVLVGCHWRHPASMHLHSAETVHTVLGAALHPLVQHVEDDFLLTVWSRRPASVATTEGIIA